jgi:pyruvate,water dikinase
MKKMDFKNEVESREKYCVAVINNGNTTVFSGDSAHKLIEEKTYKKNISNSKPDTLTGMTAYHGKVQGIVKLICKSIDVEKMEKDNILVSSSTNPDLIVAMKKAAAFVTDSGGITSHASIVSRELKIPCIVGTKFATQVLKDGDLVEVDADNGVVRILERAEDREKNKK